MFVWLRGRYAGACLSCGKPMGYHTHTQRNRCYDTPLNLRPTDRGMMRAALWQLSDKPKKRRWFG